MTTKSCLLSIVNREVKEPEGNNELICMLYRNFQFPDSEYFVAVKSVDIKKSKQTRPNVNQSKLTANLSEVVELFNM